MAARTFLLVHNRADATGQAPLKDLPGAGGRFDLVARFVVATLLTSHGVRQDTDCVVLFTNTRKQPKALRVRGSEIRGLRPDERTAASKLNEALGPIAMPVWQQAGDGVATRACTLEDLLDDLPGPLVVLDEDGEDVRGDAGGPASGTYVFGDDRGLTEVQHDALRKRADRVVSLGPVALQADQAATVLHNELDRRG